MKRVLYAWEGENRIGIFEESESSDVSFSYDSGAAYPISLSMPLDDEWSPRAPFLFLDGLLPDDANERYVMMNSLGAASIHPFDLLDSVDAAGGLFFTQVDEPPIGEPPVLQPMNEADIEAEIQRISSRRVMGWEVQPGSKFSLAGTQGKFTLVKYGKGWYRPYVGLAMPVNGKYYASELTPSDWAAEANAAGLDGNKVAEAACDISRGILMHLDEAVAMLSPSLRDAMRDSVLKANEGMQ